jgi:hypothetical protein
MGNVFTYELEHILSHTVTVKSPPEVIGPVPEGIRVNFYLTGGEVIGPKVQGKVRPVGADRLLIRADGVGVIEVCGTMETDDGALIFTSYSGIGDFGEDGYQKFLRGELPRTVPLRATARFLTAHPGYAWLNRLQGVNVGEADLIRAVVSWDVYALR